MYIGNEYVEDKELAEKVAELEASIMKDYEELLKSGYVPSDDIDEDDEDEEDEDDEE